MFTDFSPFNSKASSGLEHQEKNSIGSSKRVTVFA